MREIKFRAWDNSTREMVSSKQLGDQTWNVLSSLQRNDCNWTFMQYTGLKDKNGKEIYEGDIVSYGYYTGNPDLKNIQCLHVIEWGNNEGGFITREILDNSEHPRVEIFNAEIISNIYENPDLIN